MLLADASLHDAVSHFYQDHHGWLRGWLRRRLGCVEDVADLTQDTFARLLTSRWILDTCEPHAYLAVVVKELMINWSQRQSLGRVYLDALVNLLEDLVPLLEQRLMVLETLYEVDALLSSLPDRVCQALSLAQIEGLKYGAIVERLGVSLGSVKHYIWRAFRQCLELME